MFIRILFINIKSIQEHPGGDVFEQHAARPHASTVEMVAAARDEARQDVRDVRREMYELVRSVMPRSGEPTPFAGPNEGDTE